MLKKKSTHHALNKKIPMTNEVIGIFFIKMINNQVVHMTYTNITIWIREETHYE